MSADNSNDNILKEEATNTDYTLISPKQFYARINQHLDEPIGLRNIYQLVKEKNFPSIKIGGRFFIVESKVEKWLQEFCSTRKR